VTRVTRRTQAERSAATRAALLAAARRLFAEHGYAGTGREEIVRAAGVTRGALYHHYAGKEDLFRAVYEELEHEIMARVGAAAEASADPAEMLRLGALAYLDAALDPAVQRVVLIDGDAVLGWEVRQEIAGGLALGLVRDALAAAMDAGQIERQPVDSLAPVLLAALHEAALLVARAPDPVAARAEVGVTVERLLARL
jgi:AcrR family transcriptional regulator